jgi:hypothetical protein
MSAASSAVRATTPTNQPERVRECPGAPARPERPVGLTVDTSFGRPLFFEQSPPSTPRKKARKASKVWTEEDLKTISNELSFK